MSLRPYVGEYLISPVPLHFGLNVCSHGCFYCFANLNNPERRSDNADIRWLAKWQGDDATLIGWFLKQGYPLLVANDSDPFAASNEQTFLTLHGICKDKDIPICYQTKGGKPEHEALLLDSKPTMIYI
jgi:DNA repair photolyase